MAKLAIFCWMIVLPDSPELIEWGLAPFNTLNLFEKIGVTIENTMMT